MAKKMKKAIPWFLVATVLMVGLTVGLNVLIKNVNAGLTPTTGVTVVNVVPDDLTGTTDGSTVADPTEAGDNVTFTATGYDDNGDQWKLLICDSTGTSGTGCDDGTTWCVSASFVDSGSPNTCTFATDDDDVYSNNWFAYACDATACSATADTAASPFIVNHAPEFTDSSPDAAKNPGATVTITATANDDARDTNGQVQLYVCKEANFTGGGSPACGGTGEWGQGSLAASAPTAAFAVPDPDGEYDYYPYIIDTWGMVSDGAAQGVLDHFTVLNVAPVVSSVSLNSAGNITITANSSSSISATATISDDNSCRNKADTADEIASANAVFFQDDKVTSACSADENDCYIIASCSLGACTAGSLTATCTVSEMWYNANPTDDGAYATNQTWNADKWTAWVKGIDDDAAEDTETNSGQTIEVTTTTGLNVAEASIAYGSLDPGQSNTAANNDDTEVQSVGNAPINSKQYGSTVLTFEVTNTIPNVNQKLGLTDADWASLTYTLKDDLGTADEVDLAITTIAEAHASPPSDIIYWGLHIPDPQVSGTYAGVNTFSAVEEDTF